MRAPGELLLLGESSSPSRQPGQIGGGQRGKMLRSGTYGGEGSRSPVLKSGDSGFQGGWEKAVHEGRTGDEAPKSLSA